MKTIHNFDENLKKELILLSEDDVIEWFKTNTIRWEYDNISTIE